MELILAPQNNNYTSIEEAQVVEEQVSTSKPFIEANTIEASLEEIKANHIIPVFIKDNEPCISQVDFIEMTAQVTSEMFSKETILKPNIRLSHPIKGRVPEAKNKPASQLLEHEKTLYYERMAFVIEVPSIYDEIDGNKLTLTIGGVKAYNLDNMYNKKGSDERFKIFVGFQNKVCTNTCVWSDGFYGEIKVSTLGQLKGCLKSLIENYNARFHIHMLAKLSAYSLTDQQFALLVGRARMYTNLPQQMKANIPALLLGETQVSTVVKDYYKDDSFCRDNDGSINLWRLYNLFTGANKSSYIDNFFDRGVNAYHFVDKLRIAIEDREDNWFLN